ncbi:usherin [Clarias gariepinus]
MLFLYTLGVIAALCSVAAQGSFPKLENIAAYKSVSVAPSEATCGKPERSTFCQAARTQDDLLTCSQQFCIQECPYRSSTPRYTNLLDWHEDACLKGESQDLHPGSETGSVSFVFRNQSACLASQAAPNLGQAGSFTITVWLKPEEASVMTVFEKRSMDRLVFLLTVTEMDVQFQYSVSSGQNLSITISSAGHIRTGEWTHVALQVHRTSVSLFLNGQEEDGTAFDTKTLLSPVADVTSDTLTWIGQNFKGSDQFIGRMQDFRFYPQTLTNREIEEVYSGAMPVLHTQTSCRCPPTHPRVHPIVERYCIPNGADDTTNNRLLRLHPHAHPLNYINDNDIGTAWVSSVFSSLEDQGVSITIDLESGQYQVFYVILQFRSLQPEAVRIQRKTSSTSAWTDWQYQAKNCSWFGMEDNGPLVSPDSVNCIQFPSDISYTNGNITFSMLTPEPNLRPGYNNFYNSATLQEFVRATQVRIHLQGQYHTRTPHVPFRHRYYAVDEITISGRCECHGHAASCDTGIMPYRCACIPESHTHGANCERCAPLFNDKPFRAGNQVEAYNCRPCQCHGHAASCHYNASVDPHPQEHFRGGGGVCDNCTHNTTGRSCEQCRRLFYRGVGDSLWAKDACKPCECNNSGTVNGSLECDQIGGQCKCKRRVSGRQCNQCQQGFYKLQASLVHGCLDCNCSAAGTLWPHITCHQDSGQCQCKTNVIGLTCDRCNYGFKFLNRTNPDGCEPCGCDPDGSLHQFCNPFSGQCECKKGIQGLLCDTCPPGTYGPRMDGVCMSCNCSASGIISGSVCHPVTGQCVCRPHVEGRRCDSCRDGWYKLGLEDSLSCQPCHCDPRGIVQGSALCDKESGQCLCKSGVEGLRCNRCSAHMYNLSSANDTHACLPCNCDLVGTLAGTVCDPDSGQCVCAPTHQALDCSTCKPGYFHSDEHRGLCEACDCHPVGAAGQVCAADTGQCVCANSSLAGRKCDQCQDLYFGFNPIMGRCERCGCDPAGSFNSSCHVETGQCPCKLFVTGEKCERCVEGASHMDPANHLGCSKEPRQQPPPLVTALNASSIELSWNAPDSPNSNLLTYTLLRNREPIHTSYSQLPFGSKHFTDTALSPYTLYTYQLFTSNIHGNTSSSSVTLRTLSSVPDLSDLQLSVVGQASPTTISFNWTEPVDTSGPVEHYALSSLEEQNGEEHLHYQGLGSEVTVDGLHPFSRYSFSLQACTNGGCARSANVSVVTAQVSPQRQPAPRVSTLSPTQLHVDWEPPAMPNGIIIRYELFMQVLDDSQGNLTSPGTERRVFLSAGWLDPRQPSVLASESAALTPPESSVVVTDLEPFTAYRFRVLAVNMAGSTMSEWSIGRTAEGVPEYMSPPQVSPVSSSSLRVNWETPRVQDVRGTVTAYRVSLYQEQTSSPYAPPVVTQLLYNASADERSYTVTGLKSYKEYSFTVTVCNTQGCVSSLPAPGRTQPSAPAGLKEPRLKPVNTTAMEILWAAPAALNGPPPVYHVERTDVSFSDAEGRVIRGRRFTGTDYFHFPSSTLPVNTDFTGIQLSFRTRMEEGLILCALSPGEQEEFVALQMRNGRPYFLFDPQASVVAISPQDDGGRSYNDNQWHRLIATRKQALGSIIVDDQYRGSASATSGSTIIGQNTGVFFGGLPGNFTVLRQDTGLARLARTGFAGCVRDVLIQRSGGPDAIWEPLDWDSALEEHETYGDWEGCPAYSEHGAYFLGQGFLKLDPEVFTGGKEFEISFEFRTDQLNSLLLFAYDLNGEDYILAELQGGILSWVLRWGDQRAELALWVGLSYCDGGWNSVAMLKRGALTRAAMNHASEQHRSERGGNLNITSPLYIGGVPAGLQHPALHQYSLLHGFGGCIRDVRLAASGPVLNLAVASCAAVRVNLDGCLSADTSVNCRGNDSILVYTGNEISALDLSLQPFTEYLYRVIASGEGGWTAGPWQRGRSRETAPQSVLPPSRVASVNGSSAEVSWEEPPEVRGVIERYVVKAYSRDSPLSPPISATFNAQWLMGTLSGLSPFSSYNVTLTACTRAGCGESLRASSLTTPQAAPEDILPPRAVPHPDSLSVYWEVPRKPNGVLTHYTLYKEHTPIYQGNDTAFNITGLGVYTPHTLLLSACTEAGCTNSSVVTLSTAQLPPSHMEPPVLTVLDAHSINVRWSSPPEVNGQLQFYTLYQDVPGEEPVVVYNSSQLFEDHTLRDLVPGCTYLFQIAACTAGGCTLSAPSRAKTEESSPEGVPAPSVTYISPHALNLTWGPPLKPNGVISSYSAWMDGVLMQNSSFTSFGIVGLSPWSSHSFRVQACTAQGCALGPSIEVRTSEMPPVGSVPLEILPENPKSVWVKFEAPAKPNGNLSYSVLFTGTFFQPSGENPSEPEELVTETRSLLTAGTAGRWVSVGDLLPFSNYSVRVRACNSQGCVESASIRISLPPAAPDGLLPPRLAAATSTSLQVAWLSPSRPNAPGTLRYQLQMKNPDTQHVLQLVDNETETVFTHSVQDLEPYTEYQFRLLVSNQYGEARSSWVSLRTAQDRPESVDPPVLYEVHPRTATISWSPPSRPNGHLTHYNIYQDRQLINTVPADTTSLALSNLAPYQQYSIQVEACTEMGCTLSANSHTLHTPAAPPEGVTSPRLYSDTPTSVLLTWVPPVLPNGPLESYTLERRLNGSQKIFTVASMMANQTLTYLDSSASLSPWSTYEYRVIATTRQGGSNSSQWEQITTRPSRPAGVQPPKVLVLGPESVQVTWTSPLIPNGEIMRYEIRMPDPRISHTDTSSLNRTVTGLEPYTDYSVTILACSGGGGFVGGCTESLPTPVTTLPMIPQGLPALSIVTISESYLAVSWQPPSRPNGPDVRYKLLRRKTQQPLASRPPEDFNRWYHVYAGDKLFHEDKGLSRYTWYEYQLLVYNDVGYASGEVYSGVTLAGPPLHAPNVSAQTINHTAILLNWTTPTLQDLQGKVELYLLTVNSIQERQTLQLDPSVTSVLLSDLQPNTEYTLSLTVSNGAHNITSPEVTCITADGEPEGVFPPEIVTLNSTSVRVLWAAPLVPNGAITHYSIYLDGHVYSSTDNTSGSLELGGLQPFTVYDVQVEVCTVFACVRSNSTKLTTVEETPAEIPAPAIRVLGSRIPDLSARHSRLRLTRAPNTSFICCALTDTKLGVSNRGYQSTLSMLRVPSQSQLSHAYSQNSLHRSVSQLIDTQDKKSLAGLTWDTEQQGTESGMFVGDEEFADPVKGFSSVKKEHAVFTDTHL